MTLTTFNIQNHEPLDISFPNARSVVLKNYFEWSDEIADTASITIVFSVQDNNANIKFQDDSLEYKVTHELKTHTGNIEDQLSFKKSGTTNPADTSFQLKVRAKIGNSELPDSILIEIK
jgi:hypothetical protein